MNIVKKLTDTLTYSAGNDVQIDLPNEGIITQVDWELYLTLDAGAASTMSVLGLWRAIQNMKIEGGGGKSYFSMTGTQMGMLMHHLNVLDYPGKCWRDIVATSQYIAGRIHFGSRLHDVYGRENPFDLTAGIPAQDETNLKFTWTCAASDNTVDATRTISSGTMRVQVSEVLGQPTAGLMIPISSSESYDPGATKSDLSGQRDIPTGSYVRRIAIMAIDATAGTSSGPLLLDTLVTEAGILLPKENRRLIEVRAKQLELQNPLWDGMQVANTPNTQSPHNTTGGMYVVDLRQFDHPDYGLDARRMNTGDLKLGLTIGTYASSSKAIMWYDQVQMYAGKGI